MLITHQAKHMGRLYFSLPGNEWLFRYKSQKFTVKLFRNEFKVEVGSTLLFLLYQKCLETWGRESP